MNEGFKFVSPAARWRQRGYKPYISSARWYQSIQIYAEKSIVSPLEMSESCQISAMVSSVGSSISEEVNRRLMGITLENFHNHLPFVSYSKASVFLGVFVVTGFHPAM